MARHPVTRALPFALALLLAAPATHAGEHGKGKSLFDISLPLSFLSSLGGTMTLSCDTDVDRDTRDAMRVLERQGARARFEWTDDDSRIVATRNGERFKMRIHNDEGETVTLEMPWTVANCLFSGNSQGPRKMTVGNLQRDGGFSVKVDSDDADIHVTLH
jgi:hypothetical protein